MPIDPTTFDLFLLSLGAGICWSPYVLGIVVIPALALADYAVLRITGRHLLPAGET